MTACDCCRRPFPDDELTPVDVLEARQTHSSPAEHGTALLCPSCLEGDPRDPDYERANIAWGDSHGGHL